MLCYINAIINIITFHFLDLENLSNDLIYNCYEKMFNLIKIFEKKENKIYINNNFEYHAKFRNEKDLSTINPHILIYKYPNGQFNWHKHMPNYQKFQLVINLTEPGDDYNGGNTNIITDDNKIESFNNNNFQKGDLFSFPYHLWHEVEEVQKGKKNNSAKISLLMPIHPTDPESNNLTKYPTNTDIEYINNIKKNPN